MPTSKRSIHIAVGKNEEGSSVFFVVVGNEIVSEHRTAAEAVKARTKLDKERLEGGSWTGAGTETER